MGIRGQCSPQLVGIASTSTRISYLEDRNANSFKMKLLIVSFCCVIALAVSAPVVPKEDVILQEPKETVVLEDAPAEVADETEEVPEAEVADETEEVPEAEADETEEVPEAEADETEEVPEAEADETEDVPVEAVTPEKVE